jgi:subtilisin family serine protease
LAPLVALAVAMSLLILLVALVPSKPASAQPSEEREKPTKGEAGEANKEAIVQDLLSKAQSEGSVRVIVGLEAALPEGSFVPEGELSRSQAADQRDAIGTAQSQLLAELGGSGVQRLREYKTIPYMALELSPEALEKVRDSRRVTSIMEDKPEPVPTDQETGASQSATTDQSASAGQDLGSAQLASSVPSVQADDMWAAGFTGSGQVVAVLDTGVDKSHPFLAGKVVEEACYSARSNCPNGTTSQTGAGSGVPCTYDADGCRHGTHVAGIAAGKGSSFSGVAKDANVASVQVFSRSNTTGKPTSFPSDQIAGLERVYDLAVQGGHNVSSVNMSLGSGQFFSNCYSDARMPMIETLKSANIATVIASGNEGFTNSTNAPGCIPSAVSVGSTLDSDTLYFSSNVASFLSLLAPGASIDSSVPGGGYATLDGTSMAAPHVAGAWALLRQAHPSVYSVDSILSSLKYTGTNVADTRSGGTVTKPRINIFDASELLGDTKPPNVASSRPLPDSTGRKRAANVSVTFSEKMDTSTLGSNNVQLYLKDATTPVSATVTPSADGNSVTLDPSVAKLERGQWYQVVLWRDTFGIKDRAGNPLAASGKYQQSGGGQYLYFWFKTGRR